MKAKKNKVITLDQFKDKHYGKKGTAKRDKLETGFENFKIGVMLHQARLEKGLTQEELAEKVGTTKSYISKIENNIKEVRISTLQKIIELGLGGQRPVKLVACHFKLLQLERVGDPFADDVVRHHAACPLGEKADDLQLPMLRVLEDWRDDLRVEPVRDDRAEVFVGGEVDEHFAATLGDG